MKKLSLRQYIRQYHTVKTTESYLYSIEKFIEQHPGSEKYKYDDIVRLLEKLAYKNLTKDYRIRILASIKKYYDYLVFMGKRKDHPCRGLYIKRSKAQVQTHLLFTMEELNMLKKRFNRYKYLDARNQVIISFLLFQALTSEELISLDVSNIDFDNNTIYIKASKKLHRRTIDLHPDQAEQIRNYITEKRSKLAKENVKNLLVTKSGDQMTVDGIHAMIEPMKELFPDKVLNPKRIRQSVISFWLNERNLPLEDVMDLSGIKWPSSVLMYKRIDVKNQRAIINRFHPLG